MAVTIATEQCSLTSGIQSFDGNDLELSFLNLPWALVNQVKHCPGFGNKGCALYEGKT